MSSYEIDTLAYLRAEAGSYPRLTVADEKRLGQQIQVGLAAEKQIKAHPDADAETLLEWEGQIRDGKAALEQFVNSNLRLVISEASKLGNGPNTVDLVQEGNIGLVKAVLKFDPNRAKFGTMAVYWIRQAMRRSLTNTSRAISQPARVSDNQRMIIKATEDFAQTHSGRAPTREELANEIQRSVEAIEEAARAPRVTDSLDRSVGADGDPTTSLGDMIPCEYKDPAEQMFHNDLSAQVRDSLERLDPEIRQFVFERYMLDDGGGCADLETVAARMGINYAAALRMEQQARGILAEHLSEFARVN